MTKEEMVFYFHQAQHLSWEKFQKCMIQPDDDGDTCEDKIRFIKSDKSEEA